MKKHNNISAFHAGIVSLVLAALAMCSATLEAQQLPQISQYMLNDYVINPAVAGSEDHFQVRAMNRDQWTGLTDAPRTFTLSLTAPFRNPHIGMGGYIYVDNAGPTRRTGAQVSYAWHMNLSEEIRLGLAASAGIVQFAIDGSRIEMATEGDPALYSELNSQILFDAKFGMYLYSDDFHLGISLPQLMQNQVNLYDSENVSMSRLEDHYMLMAGYKIRIGDDFVVEPSTLVKYVTPTPLKIDGTLKVSFRDMFWLGGSWRNNDAIVAFAGCEWRESISLGYAYDFTTSNLRYHSNGTHEIVVGFRFNQ